MNGVRDAAEDFFRCGFCRKFYKKPKVFTCLHSFCTECLQQEAAKTINGKLVQCPVCDVVGSLPAGGVHSLVDNEFAVVLQNLKIGIIAQRRCSQDGSQDNNNVSRTSTPRSHRTAISKCLECDANYCEHCAKLHLKNTETQLHKVTMLPRISFDRGTVVKEDFEQCRNHPQQTLTQFCQPCQAPICKDCKNKNHTSHKCTELDSAIPTFEYKIHKAVSPLTAKREAAEDMLENLCTYQDSFTKWIIKTKQDIEEHTAGIIQKIEQQKNELLDQLLEIRQQAEKEISAQHRKYVSFLTCLRNTQRFSRYLVNHGSAREVISLTKHIEDNAKRLEKETFADIPKHIAFFVAHTPDITLGKVEEKKYQSFQLFNEINTSLGTITSTTVKEDKILVTGENNNNIIWYNLNGEITDNIQLVDYKPSHAVPLHNGKICITEPSQNQMIILGDSEDANNIVGKDFLKTPRGLAVNNEGQIVVTDIRSASIHILSEEGDLLKTTKFSNGNSLPWYITSTPDDCLVVSDRCQHYAMLINSDGHMVRKYGRLGSGDKELDCPAGVCTDYHGNILLADTNNNRIHLLTRELRFKKFLLTKEDGIDHPRTLAFVASSRHLIVGQCDGIVKIFHCYA